MSLNRHYDDWIMDTTNGHSPELVDKINKAWSKKKEKFHDIIVALYRRDIDEITDSDAFQYEPWKSTSEYKKGVETGDWSLYNRMALEFLEHNWENEAYNYLMHVADDLDIETILSFVRYKE